MSSLYESYNKKTDDELVAILYLGEKYYDEEVISVVKQIILERDIEEIFKNPTKSKSMVPNINKYYKESFLDTILELDIPGWQGDELLEFNQQLIDRGKSILKELGVDNPTVPQAIEVIKDFRAIYRTRNKKLWFILLGILLLIMMFGYLSNMLFYRP